MAREGEPGSLGRYLRARREETGASLADVARVTRISAYHLAALESDDLSELPAPVFVKGFIRAYCGCLGIPVDDALALFHAMPGVPAAPPARPVVSPSRRSWIGHPLTVSLALLVAFGAGVLALNLGTRRAPPSPPVPVAMPMPEAVPQAAPEPAPSPTVSRQTETPPHHRLVVKAVEATWIRVQADDGRAVEELLPPGATREWTAGRGFMLTIGNAGGIEIELNGRTLPSLGARGAVIHRLSLPQLPAAGS